MAQRAPLEYRQDNVIEAIGDLIFYAAINGQQAVGLDMLNQLQENLEIAKNMLTENNK